MKIGYLDCFSGISGDMLLGAFIDAGWNKEELLELPHLLGLKGVAISIKRVSVKGLSGLKVEIIAETSPSPQRHLDEIKEIIASSSLPDKIKCQATAAFEKLAKAEAKIHGIPVEKVHFHETGAIDAIIDVTGGLLARYSLGLDTIFCSPLPLSRGFVTCSHGTIPLPAPAVLELLKDKKVFFVGEDKELVTPTGALLAVTLSDKWAEPPPMKILNIGYGAGTWDLNERPNLLRIVLGQSEGVKRLTDEVVEMTTVIDDMNPEHLGHFMETVLENGATDAWIRQVLMKKNRPGFEITVLSSPDHSENVSDFILSNTTSSGLRIRKTMRIVLERKIVNVKTRWGILKAKAIFRPDGTRQVVPEFEECKKISEKLALPIGRVYNEVICAKEVDEEK